MADVNDYTLFDAFVTKFIEAASWQAPVISSDHEGGIGMANVVVAGPHNYVKVEFEAFDDADGSLVNFVMDVDKDFPNGIWAKIDDGVSFLVADTADENIAYTLQFAEEIAKAQLKTLATGTIGDFIRLIQDGLISLKD